MSSDRTKQPAQWKKTATNSNPNNEETAPSAGTNSRTPASAVASIQPRSPRKMKTQIAKLVYNPSIKPNRNVVMNENEKPVDGEEFQKKREDRDREVKEIQEMLNEITNSPSKVEKTDDEHKVVQQGEKITVTKIENTKLAQPMQRSKTETNIRPLATRRTQLRKKSQTTRSKSAQPVEKENPSTSQRQKTYNAEEARRYMQEQRKKRKSLQTNPQASGGKPIDRNEIKKRLEDLRKNTRQIVNKNVKLAKKKTMNGPVEIKQCIQAQPSKTDVEKMSELHIDSTRVGIWTDREPKKSAVVSHHQDPSPLSENYKRIGLLRKPEFKDHSFSALKGLSMDKENLVLDILNPQLAASSTSRLNIAEHKEIKKSEMVLGEKMENNIDLEQNCIQEPAKKCPQTSSKISSIPDLDLKIPEAKLRSHVSLREKSIQVDKSAIELSKKKPKNSELPYWLKPTSAQIYPYNFIMAVRKKLEAIASPPALASSSSLENQSKRKATDTPPKANERNNVKRRLLDNEDKSSEKSSSARRNLMNSQSLKSLTNETSNFSSMSIHLPDSNTVSSFKKPSSPKQVHSKPERFDEDDTTVSSSVFSSPEKKKNLTQQSSSLTHTDVRSLSPLSMENISNLKIKSKSKLKNVTLGRGDNFPNTSAHHRVDSGAVSSRSEGSIDFSQLLDDFNRSLSQVIEVNHQLKTTLDKSHKIFSPEKKKRSVPPPLPPSSLPVVTPSTDHKIGALPAKSFELTDYVSDFEASSIAEEKNSKDSAETRTSRSIPEIQILSAKSSEIETETTQKSASSTEETVEEEESSTQRLAEEIPKSQDRSFASLESQTFVISSEEQPYDSLRSQTIQGIAVEESPNKQNLSANNFSRDSLEVSPREEYIKSHINISRGDFQDDEIEHSVGPPPSYKPTTKSKETPDRSQSNLANTTFDSEFVRVFNKSDMEVSTVSLNRSVSESTLNYSSIGLYEKLIQNETNKSDHLAALLKMREKALLDRTKGQIAWLEVQKERYKAKGLTLQISAVKKKQRGILLKMEKEREEIKKLLQQAKVQRDYKLRIPESRPSSDVTLLQQRRAGFQTSAALQAASFYQKQKQPHQQQQQQQQYSHRNLQQSPRSKTSAIVRGYELETSRSLEQLLQKREEDLRRRREHVERLMEWHRRLDQEEAEVLQLERMLLDYNNVHVPQENHNENENENAQGERKNQNQAKMEKKLMEIDRSLRELSNISSAGGSADTAGAGAGAGDFVRTSGSKLNKLWRRLTSQRIEKFEPNKRYKLCKSDLEQLYEDAKLAVLHDFGENADQMEVFLGQTSLSTTQQSTYGGEIPQLNLNFSSGQSDVDMMRGNYSPSAAEGEFLVFTVPSTSSKEAFSEESGREDVSESKRRMRNASGSLSSVPSLPKSDESGSSIQSATKSFDSESSHRASVLITTDGNSRSAIESLDNSERTLIPEVVKFSGFNSKIDGKQISVTESAVSVKIGSVPTTDDSCKTTSIQTNLTDGIVEAGQESRTSIPENASTSGAASNESIRTGLTDDSKNMMPSVDISYENERISFLESTSGANENSKSINIKTNDLESALNSELTTKSESSRTSLIKSALGSEEVSIYSLPSETFQQNASKTSLTETEVNQISSVENGKSPTSKVYTQNGVLNDLTSTSAANIRTENYQKSLTEAYSASHTDAGSISTPSNILKTDSNTAGFKSESDKIISSASKSKIQSDPGNLKEIVSRTASHSQKESSASRISENLSSIQSNSSHTLSALEDSDTASIVRSLLNCSSISSRTFITENQSATPSLPATASVIPESDSNLSTNGQHEFEDCPSVSIQNRLRNDITIEDHTSKQSPISSAAEQINTTLRSIESTEKSTNSKHSTDPTTNLETVSNSSKPHSASIESDIVQTPREPSFSEQTLQYTEEIASYDSTKVQSENAVQTYSLTFDQSVSEAPESISPNELRSSVIISTKDSHTDAEISETLTNAFYESDFTEGDETNIDDLSLPRFETSTEEDQYSESPINHSQSSFPFRKTELENRLIDLDTSLKGLDATFEKALSPEKSPSPPRGDVNKKNQQLSQTKEQSDSALMPDIISEVELRRRQQMMLETEMKQFEHAVPYMYVREIPNKPPPPYVPPAHGSPMTTIFPSEDRIRDITYRRTKELYCELFNIETNDENGKKPPSVLDENITNIYERIILDICKEYLTEYKPVLSSADPNNFHSQLAFFNPPDRLKCMQDFIYKEVRKSLAMDKNSPKRNQAYSVYGHRGKRDHVGEIIIQEMFEEDDRWSNFYVEEAEVLELIIDELIGGAIGEIATEVLEEEVLIDPNTPAATDEVE